jgi:CubicO group peptidase (beta-lactamase class C family)
MSNNFTVPSLARMTLSSLIALTATPLLAQSLKLSQTLSRNGANSTYLSEEFKKTISSPARKKQCEDFLRFVEGQTPGKVSANDNTPWSNFNTYGILIAKKDGTVLLEKYYQGTQRKNKFRMYSISKLFSVLSFGNLEKDGFLRRSDLVKHYLADKVEATPGINYPYWNDLRIDHLLTMSSGIPWCEYVNCAGRDALAMSFKPGRDDTLKYYFQNSIRGASAASPLSRPGDRYTYSAGNAVVLQGILKKTLQESYDSYPFERILKNLDISKDEYSFEQDAQGVFLGGSGMFLTLPAMAKLGLVLLNKGSYESTQFGKVQIANSQFVSEMTEHI